MGADRKAFGALAVCVLAYSVSFTYVFSIGGFMLVDMGEVESKDKAGYKLGYVISAFMLGRFMSGMPWGYVADIYGRRPVILFGLFSIIFTTLGFGFSNSMIGLMAFRFIGGLLNPVIATAKTMSAELSDDGNQTIGMSIITGFYSLGLILGPAVSGVLVKENSGSIEDQMRYNSTKSYLRLVYDGELIKVYPYILPSLISVILSLVAFVVVFLFLPETYIKKDNKASSSEYEMVKTRSDEEEEVKDIENAPENEIDSNIQQQGKKNQKWKRICFVLFIYCIYSYMELFIAEVIPLWVMSTFSKGGLEFSPDNIGALMAAGGIVMLIANLVVFPILGKRYPPVSIFIFSSFLTGIFVMFEPVVVHAFYKISTFGLWTALIFMNTARISFLMFGMTAIFVITNNSATSDIRGRVNGISMAVASLFKMLGPTTGGITFAWSIESHGSNKDNIFDYHFTFYLDGILAFLTCALAFFCMSRELNHPSTNNN